MTRQPWLAGAFLATAALSTGCASGDLATPQMPAETNGQSAVLAPTPAAAQSEPKDIQSDHDSDIVTPPVTATAAASAPTQPPVQQPELSDTSDFAQLYRELDALRWSGDRSSVEAATSGQEREQRIYDVDLFAWGGFRHIEARDYEYTIDSVEVWEVLSDNAVALLVTDTFSGSRIVVDSSGSERHVESRETPTRRGLVVLRLSDDGYWRIDSDEFMSPPERKAPLPLGLAPDATFETAGWASNLYHWIDADAGWCIGFDARRPDKKLNPSWTACWGSEAQFGADPRTHIVGPFLKYLNGKDSPLLHFYVSLSERFPRRVSGNEQRSPLRLDGPPTIIASKGDPDIGIFVWMQAEPGARTYTGRPMPRHEDPATCLEADEQPQGDDPYTRTGEPPFVHAARERFEDDMTVEHKFEILTEEFSKQFWFAGSTHTYPDMRDPSLNLVGGVFVATDSDHVYQATHWTAVIVEDHDILDYGVFFRCR